MDAVSCLKLMTRFLSRTDGAVVGPETKKGKHCSTSRSHFLLTVLLPPVGGQFGRRQEATAGRDAQEGGWGEPHSDPEGGTGLPEEYLLRGECQ